MLQYSSARWHHVTVLNCIVAFVFLFKSFYIWKSKLCLLTELMFISQEDPHLVPGHHSLQSLYWPAPFVRMAVHIWSTLTYVHPMKYAHNCIVPCCFVVVISLWLLFLADFCGGFTNSSLDNRMIPMPIQTKCFMLVTFSAGTLKWQVQMITNTNA